MPVKPTACRRPRPANTAERRPTWPQTVVTQITALKALAEQAPVTAAEATAAFDGARQKVVARLLDTLAILGELQEVEGGRYRSLAVVARARADAAAGA